MFLKNGDMKKGGVMGNLSQCHHDALLERLNELCDRCLREVQFAEAKNATLLIAVSAIFVYAITHRVRAYELNVFLFFEVLYLIYLCFVFCHAFSPFKPDASMTPTNLGVTPDDIPDDIKNIAFWGELCKYPSGRVLCHDLAKSVFHDVQPDKHERFTFYEKSIAAQIIKISQIAHKKHSAFKKTLAYFNWALALLVVLRSIEFLFLNLI